MVIATVASAADKPIKARSEWAILSVFSDRQKFSRWSRELSTGVCPGECCRFDGFGALPFPAEWLQDTMVSPTNFCP
jgi:hypothetical protein